MAQQILLDGDSGFDYRTKENENFTELYQTAQTIAITRRETEEPFPLTTTPVTIPFGDVTLTENNMTYDPITGIFTNIYPGIYTFDFFMSASWGNGTDIILETYHNGAATGNRVILTGQGSGTYIPLGVPSVTVIAANSTLEIRASTVTGSTTFNVNLGSIMLSLKVYTG